MKNKKKALPKRNRWVKFGYWPNQWFLSGELREIAQAEYYYEGRALKRVKKKIGVDDVLELREIDAKFDFNEGVLNRLKYRKETLAIQSARVENELILQQEQGLLSKKEATKKSEELKLNQQIDLLEIELKEGLITEPEHNKAKADLLKEPWVDVVQIVIDTDNPCRGDFDLDWNDLWVEHLSNHGYMGASDEDVVDAWFNDVCKTILQQQAADQNYGMEDREIPISERDDVEIIRDEPKPREESPPNSSDEASDTPN